jgi:hypothetical protein
MGLLTPTPRTMREMTYFKDDPVTVRRTTGDKAAKHQLEQLPTAVVSGVGARGESFRVGSLVLRPFPAPRNNGRVTRATKLWCFFTLAV